MTKNFTGICYQHYTIGGKYGRMKSFLYDTADCIHP